MIIIDEKRGPIRVVFEAYGGALALFSPPQANKAKKIALERGGKYWIAVWMMRRFSKYAYFLGHRNGRRWNNRKRRQLGTEPIPFYGLTPPGGGPAAPGYSQINGAKMKDAVRGAKVKAIGIAGRERLDILVPYGHPIRTEDSNAFKRLPQREVNLIAKEIGDELGRIISAAQVAPQKKHAQPRDVGGPKLKLSGRYAPTSRRKVG